MSSRTRSLPEALTLEFGSAPLSGALSRPRAKQSPTPGVTWLHNDQEQRKPCTNQFGADGCGDRIGGRAAGSELGPRCPSTAHRRRKPHPSEPGARPLAHGGPGDQTLAPSAWRFALTATTDVRCCAQLGPYARSAIRASGTIATAVARRGRSSVRPARSALSSGR